MSSKENRDNQNAKGCVPVSKKIVSVALTLVMLLSAFAMAESPLQVIQLGTSGLAIIADASYVKGEITSDDTDESQVAYYYSDAYLLDFDIYQWAVAEGETLSETAAEEAAEYGAECAAVTLNGIDAYMYEAIEESDGDEYPTATYMMKNGDVFVEIVFWMDGDEAAELVKSMLDTLAVVDDGKIKDEGNVIALGTSQLMVSLPYVYEKGEISAEDTDEGQVAYYFSEETTVDFDVYQWAKADDETLADVVAEEAAEFGAEAQEITVNGITLAYYYAVEESEGAQYNTVTYIAEDGSDFVEIVFWLDGENAAEIVDSIIGSIAR